MNEEDIAKTYVDKVNSGNVPIMMECKLLFDDSTLIITSEMENVVKKNIMEIESFVSHNSGSFENKKGKSKSDNQAKSELMLRSKLMCETYFNDFTPFL